MKQPCILCDIDGTVAEITHRLHYIDETIRPGDIIRPVGQVGAKYIHWEYIEQDGEGSDLTWIKDPFDGATFLVSGKYKKVKKWVNFFEACIYDKPIVNNIKVVQALSQIWPVIFMSGRPIDYAKQTLEWLNSNGLGGLGWPYDQFRVPTTVLHMRKQKDTRQDYIIKEELYKEFVEPYYEPLVVIDDRKQVVDMWRRLGLNTWQVQEGNY